MPTIIDSTVINQAYDTSGNGGRKVVKSKTSNTLIAASKNTSTNTYQLQKSTDGGNTWTSFGNTGGGVNRDYAAVTVGDNLYAIYTDFLSNIGYVKFYGKNITTGTFINSSNDVFEAGQTDIQNCSLIANNAGTELHAVWSSKNSPYLNTWNLRYIKGTINVDGSVTWGSVVQVTSQNSVSYIGYTTPTITLNSTGYPVIIAQWSSTSPVYNLMAFTTTDYITFASRSMIGGSDTPYSLSNPSAIFVPQSVNGLTNGRIWVAWHGKDATDVAVNNLRVVYSDDGGVTWSAMQKLTSGNTYDQYYASITAYKNGDISIVFQGKFATSSTYEQIRKIKYSNSVWGSVVDVTNGSTFHSQFPSALFDLTVNATEPLFIYKTSTKVGFYGTWVYTGISVPQGSIGNKTSADMSNFLTYTITSDGTMTTVTEKLNGTVIGTKTPTSGQSNVIALSQSQWDGLKYSKYKNATGGFNTLTIEMGSDIWTYTFNKLSSSLDSPEQVIQAESDVNTIMFPSVKTNLANSINSRGSTIAVTGSDSWDTLNNAINTLGRMPIIGTITSSSSTGTFTYLSGSTNTSYYVTVTGLPAKPTFIYVFYNNASGSTTTSIYSELTGDQYLKTIKVTQAFSNASASGATWHYKADVTPASVINGSFTLPVYNASTNYTYIAYFD